MKRRLLLYGATGYSGRLIAAEAQRRLKAGWPLDVVLGGRDRLALEEMSERLELPHIVFALDDRRTVEKALGSYGVVLNAAGPFARTAPLLAKSAIATDCHYVDINGEVDVYQALDDLGRIAANRMLKMVSGAGYTATVSDLMLEWALRLLKESRGGELSELGEVRLAFTVMPDMSRGSALTMLRLIREEVLIVRGGANAHVPVGRLERAFDFHVGARVATAQPPDSQIASAVNVLDTLTAFYTTSRRGAAISGSIVSYIAMPRLVRFSYQFGALSAAFLQLPPVQQLTRLQLAQLPEGPDEEDRRQVRQHVVLQIESVFSELLADWCLETPNSYDLTAQCALAVAEAVLDGKGDYGWNTPAQVLALEPPVHAMDTAEPVRLSARPLQDCVLHGRPVWTSR
jgi:short subunit dehydrogenase-like uncharacterized protein